MITILKFANAGEEPIKWFVDSWLLGEGGVYEFIQLLDCCH